MSGRKRIMVVGHSGAGKDTACRFLAEVTLLRFAGTTSDCLARHVAARMGVSVQQAYRTRHANRNLWHRVGNGFLTLLSNMFTNLNLTDMETGYKVFRREIIQRITIEENRFGFEPEITAKVAKIGCRIYEVGISYYGRTYAEGKKVSWKDGMWAIWCIIKYNLFSSKLI